MDEIANEGHAFLQNCFGFISVSEEFGKWNYLNYYQQSLIGDSNNTMLNLINDYRVNGLIREERGDWTEDEIKLLMKKYRKHCNQKYIIDYLKKHYLQMKTKMAIRWQLRKQLLKDLNKATEKCNQSIQINKTPEDSSFAFKQSNQSQESSSPPFTQSNQSQETSSPPFTQSNQSQESSSPPFHISNQSQESSSPPFTQSKQ